MMTSEDLRLLFRSLRPLQWTKNGFILIPLFFARRLLDPFSLSQTFLAVLSFCALTGAVYLINDLFDLESDRRHPVKKNRPIAAGLLSPGKARAAAFVLLALSVGLGAWVGEGFLLVSLIYLAIQLLYSYRLKQWIIVDIFCISSGFFLRVVAGALAIRVEVSHWLIICSVMVSMFLALTKRRHERTSLGEAEAGNHRKVLDRYSPHLLDQMIAVITACTVLSYMLYCVSPETVEKFGTDHMIYTSPFVLFGIFRYLYLVHERGGGGEPERILFSDFALVATLVLWAASSVAVVYGVI